MLAAMGGRISADKGGSREMNEELLVLERDGEYGAIGQRHILHKLLFK